MRIWILRHGQAEPMAPTDAQRPLTETGRDEAITMARQLAGEPLDAILASPFVRAQQTAALVQQTIGYTRSIATAAWLTPDDDPRQAVEYLGERSETNLLLVSHQPLVSQLVSLLVEGHRRGHYPMPTAGLACVDMDVAACGLASLSMLLTPADFAR